MRYELTDHEWTAIKPALPNKPRGVPRINDRRDPQWHLLRVAIRSSMARLYWIRALAVRKGVLANIPPRCNRSAPICFSPYLYRARNLVEWLFNKIKHCRRVATRYDKLAANYLAFVQLASIRLWLRVSESTS
jgi:transposase